MSLSDKKQTTSIIPHRRNSSVPNSMVLWIQQRSSNRMRYVIINTWYVDIFTTKKYTVFTNNVEAYSTPSHHLNPLWFFIRWTTIPTISRSKEIYTETIIRNVSLRFVAIMFWPHFNPNASFQSRYSPGISLRCASTSPIRNIFHTCIVLHNCDVDLNQ